MFRYLAYLVIATAFSAFVVAEARQRNISIKGGDQLHVVIPNNGVRSVNLRYYSGDVLYINQNMAVMPGDRFILTIK